MRILINIVLFLFVVFLVFAKSLFNFEDGNIRGKLGQRKRLFFRFEDNISITVKNYYLKNAKQSIQSNSIGKIALQMNLMEANYHIPYNWGGDIFDYKEGFDCTGFVHGVMYLCDYKKYRKRFSTSVLYHMFKMDSDFNLIFSSKENDISNINYSDFNVSDIFLWPPVKNQNYYGHIGIVSKKTNNTIYITHFVNDQKLNQFDHAGIKGPGINTIILDSLLNYKRNDFLLVYRKN